MKDQNNHRSPESSSLKSSQTCFFRSPRQAAILSFPFCFTSYLQPTLYIPWVKREQCRWHRLTTIEMKMIQPLTAIYQANRNKVQRSVCHPRATQQEDNCPWPLLGIPHTKTGREGRQGSTHTHTTSGKEAHGNHHYPISPSPTIINTLKTELQGRYSGSCL